MAYLKSISDSLMGRVLPDVAKSIFREESNKITSFKEKLADAKTIYADSVDKVKSTANEFDGIKKISNTAMKQAKSGKFGTDKKWEDDYFDRKMMGGDSGGNSGDNDSLDALDNFDFGDMGGDSGDTNNYSNTQNNFVTTDNSAGLSNISDRIVDSNSILNSSVQIGSRVSAVVGSRMLGLTSRISSDISMIAKFHTDSTTEFYQASLEFYKIQTDLAEMMSTGLPQIIIYAEEGNKERAAKKSANMIAENEELSALLDPSRLMTKLTDDSMFNMLFDENMSIVGSMLAKFSSDPLGVIVGSALGAGISNMFGTQIEFIKHQAGKIEYQIQEILEEWSVKDKNSPLGFMQNALGNLLKVDRDTSGEVGIGTYENKDIGFDLQTKKAIVDVIPMYLAKILKAVANADDYEVYDHSTGKFSSAKSKQAELQQRTTDIAENNFFGGLGKTSSEHLDNDSRLSPQMREDLKRELGEMSLRGNSSRTNLNNVSFGDDAKTEAWQNMFSGLSQKEQYALEKSFFNNKFDRQKNKKKFENEINNKSQAAQAITLLDGNLNIGEESETERNTRRINGPATGNPTADNLINRAGAASDAVRDRVSDNVVNPLNDWLDEGDSTNLSFKDKIITKFDNAILLPLKMRLLGDTLEVAKDTSLLKSMNIFMNDTVLMPFKKALVGEERAKDLGFFNSLFTRVDESILIPLKQKLLGKDTTIEDAKESGLWKAIKFRVDESVIIPFKQKLLGPNADDETVRGTSLFQSISQRLNESVLIPFKRVLLGKDTDLSTIKETGLWKSISFRIDKSILMPFKQVLLGKDTDRETVKNSSLWQSISNRFDKSILFPFKKLLLGGNENKAAKFSLWKSINHRLDRSVFMPLKTMLIGNDERGLAEVKKTSLWKSLKIGFTEKIVEPLSGMLFGQDKKKLGFFKNLGATMSPFFNKLLFGHDKASKGGFIQNLKTEGKALWSSLWNGAKDRFFLPAINTFKEFFGPVLKDFSKTLGSEIKHFGSMILGKLGGTVNGSITDGIKNGAKNLFKNVFGDETVDLLRNNIIKPLQDLTKTLTDNMSKVFKFLLRLPLNFLKGITDTMKINRMESGRGNYSEEETARLQALKKSGTPFNFLDLGGTNEQNDALNSLNSASSKRDKANIFSRIFSSGTKNSPEAVVDNITADPATRVANATEAKSNERQGINPTTDTRTFTPATPAANLVETKNAALKAASDSKDAAVKAVTDSKAAVLTASNTSANTAAAVASTSLASAVQDNTSSTTTIFKEVGNKLSTLINHLTTATAGKKGSLLGSGETHATSEMANGAMVALNTKMTSLLPTTIGMATTTSAVHRFLKENLSKVGTRVDTIVRIMKKKNRIGSDDLRGGGDNDRSRFFRNPLSWLTGKFTGAIAAAGGAIAALGTSVFKVAGSLLTLPGKIIGSLVNAVAGVANAALKLTTDVVNSLATAATGIVKGLGIAIANIAQVLGKVISGALDAVASIVAGAGKFVAQVVGPLSSALGTLASGIIKGISPVIEALSKGLTSLVSGIIAVTEGLAKFTWGIIAATGRALGKITGISLGGSGAGGGGFGRGVNKVEVVNFFDLLKASKLMPLQVFIRGGKVGIIEPKAKRVLRNTNFTDNVEDRLGNRKRKGGLGANADEPKDEGLIPDALENALGAGAGTLAGTLLAKITGPLTKGLGSFATMLMGALGVSKLGRVFKKLGGSILGVVTKIPVLGGLVDKIINRNRVGPPLPPGGGPPPPPGSRGRVGRAWDAVKGKFTRTPPVPPLVGPPVPPIVGPPLPPPPPVPVSGAARALKFVGKVGKGVGIGAAIGMGGNLAADMIFDEGTAGNAVMGSASTMAGWGAMAGSIIPGVGTAIGAAVGGLIGAIYEGFPRLLKWFEEKYEVQIKKVTEVFMAIPEKLTIFVDTLPDKITKFTESIPDKLTGFMESLPHKITALLAPDNGWTLGPNGESIESKPSILGGLFNALGKAIWSLIKSIPSILISLNEGLAKIVAAVTITAVAGLASALTSGFGSMVLAIGQIFEQAVVGVRARIGNEWGGQFIGGISEEEKVQKLNEIDKKYANRAASVSNYVTSINDGGKSLANSASRSINFSKGFKDTFTFNKIQNDSSKEFNAKTRAANKPIMMSGVANAATTAAKTTSMSVDYSQSTMHNVGTPTTAGTGGSGSYASAPISRGKGWNANKELIAFSSQATGVPMDMLAKIGAIESGFDPYAKSKSSSASGMFQFITGTWDTVKRQFASKYGIPSGSNQFDARANALLGAAHIKDNMNTLSKIKGTTPNATDVYLAHFLGSGGAQRFLRGLKSNPSQSALNLVNSGQASANKSIFYLNGKPRTANAVYSLFSQRLDSKAASLGVGGVGGGNYGDTSSVAAGGNVSGGGGSGEVDMDALEGKLMYASYFNKMADIQGGMSSVYKQPPPIKMDMQQIINNATQPAATSQGNYTDNAPFRNGDYEDVGNAVAGSSIPNAKSTPFVSNSTLSDLRIKSAEATGGGQVRQHTADFARVAQGALGGNLKYFSSMNDRFHKNKGGEHPAGNAFDIVLNNGQSHAQVTSMLRKKAAEQGFAVKILNEYAKPSKNSTGGHIHVSVTGRGQGSAPAGASIPSGGYSAGGEVPSNAGMSSPVISPEIAALTEQYVGSGSSSTSAAIAATTTSSGSSSKTTGSTGGSKTKASSKSSSVTADTSSPTSSTSTMNVTASTVNINGQNLANNLSSIVDSTKKSTELFEKYNTTYVGGGRETKDGEIFAEAIADKFKTTFVGKGRETQDGEIYDKDSLAFDTNINNVLRTFTTRRDKNGKILSTNRFDGADKFSTLFDGPNATDETPIKVTIDDSTTDAMHRERAMTATNNANVHRIVTAEDMTTNEMKEQTSLLREIAENTKKGAALQQDNFFTNKSATTDGENVTNNNLVDKTKRLEATMAMNSNYQDIKASLDTFPTYIQPSKGAVALSKGGNIG